MPLRSHTKSAEKRGSRGFTLIEVLVAMLVLSIGLLGLAMLQLESIKYNTDAYFRTQATMLAYDIIDRMKANIDAAKTGAYVASSRPTQTCGNTAPGCGTTATLATYDLDNWYARIATALPPDATESSITQAGNQHTIIIRWNERGVAKTRTWVVEL